MADLKYMEEIATCETTDDVVNIINSLFKAYPQLQSISIRYKYKEIPLNDIRISRACGVYIKCGESIIVESKKTITFYKITRVLKSSKS